MHYLQSVCAALYHVTVSTIICSIIKVLQYNEVFEIRVCVADRLLASTEAG
jgi:hypothetical protein